jgi:hypothetical protein
LNTRILIEENENISKKNDFLNSYNQIYNNSFILNEADYLGNDMGSHPRKLKIDIMPIDEKNENTIDSFQSGGYLNISGYFLDEENNKV